MRSRQGVRDAVLPQIITGGHFSAKTVAAVRDGHFRRGIGRGLHQHRNFQPRKTHGVGDGAFVAEIRQRDDHAVNAVGIGAEEFGATHGLFVGFDRAVIAQLHVQNHHIHAGFLQHLYHLCPAQLGKVAREKAAISHNQPQRDFRFFHGSLHSAINRSDQVRTGRNFIRQKLRTTIIFSPAGHSSWRCRACVKSACHAATAKSARPRD